MADITWTPKKNLIQGRKTYNYIFTERISSGKNAIVEAHLDESKNNVILTESKKLQPSKIISILGSKSLIHKRRQNSYLLIFDILLVLKKKSIKENNKHNLIV